MVNDRDEALHEAARLRSEGVSAVAGPYLKSDGDVGWKIFFSDSDSKKRDRDSENPYPASSGSNGEV